MERSNQALIKTEMQTMYLRTIIRTLILKKEYSHSNQTWPIFKVNVCNPSVRSAIC